MVHRRSVRLVRAVLTGIAAAFLASGTAMAGPADTGPINSIITGDIVPTHDPVLVREKNTYYVYSTGLHIGGSPSVMVKTSPDLVHWTAQKPPIAKLPDWAQKVVPGTQTMWAPDLTYWNGRWHMYYALSTFGSNRSAIGLYTSPTLDSAAPGYGWTDQGVVFTSHPGDDYNAIDPAQFTDHDGKHWLAFGSFWGGIQLIALDAKTGKPMPSAKPMTIARRLAPAHGPAPIEAPYLVAHGGYYYLFASYDYCCKGVNSTYYTVVGRSRNVRGPYVGRDGSKLLDGEGTVIVKADLEEKDRFRGPGHSGFLHDADGKDYLVYHAYDKANHGAPTLRISPIRWDAQGWPVAVD